MTKNIRPRDRPPHAAALFSAGYGKAVGKYLEEVKRLPVQSNAVLLLQEMVADIEQGNAIACWNLGECFLRGKLSICDAPFPKDKKSAEFWFHRSAEMGCTSSQYNLGVMYLSDTAPCNSGLDIRQKKRLERGGMKQLNG